jgi:hypothetical protein
VSWLVGPLPFWTNSSLCAQMAWNSQKKISYLWYPEKFQELGLTSDFTSVQLFPSALTVWCPCIRHYFLPNVLFSSYLWIYLILFIIFFFF